MENQRIKYNMIKKEDNYTKSKKRILENNCPENYKRLLLELFNLKKNGDWKKISVKLNISAELVQQSFFRVGSPNHEAVVKALDKIIDERQKYFIGMVSDIKPKERRKYEVVNKL